MKRKTTNLVIVLLSFLIAALIALAVFMTWFTKEQTAFLEKSLRDVKNEHSVQDSSDTADTSDHIVSSSCHHFLFVGDSRTVGMEEAMQDSDDADTCSYIGKVGEGYYWLVNEGIDQLRTSLSKEPDFCRISGCFFLYYVCESGRRCMLRCFQRRNPGF